MRLCCGRRWCSGAVPPFRCGVCPSGAIPWPVQGRGTVQRGPYSLDAFLPPTSPAGAETASGPAAPPFRAGRGHICRIVGKVIGGKLLSCPRHTHWAWPAGHPSGPPRSFLERMKALFMRWPATADLSSTLMSLPLFTGFNFAFAHGIAPTRLFIQRCFRSAGPHSSPCGAGPSTPDLRLCRQSEPSGPQRRPRFRRQRIGDDTVIAHIKPDATAGTVELGTGVACPVCAAAQDLKRQAIIQIPGNGTATNGDAAQTVPIIAGHGKFTAHGWDAVPVIPAHIVPCGPQVAGLMFNGIFIPPSKGDGHQARPRKSGPHRAWWSSSGTAPCCAEND